MCNLYEIRATRLDLRHLARQVGLGLVTTSATDNLAPGFVGADSDGAVLRRVGDKLELARLRWGFPPTAAKTRAGKWAPPITNIRNLGSPWWKNVNREYVLAPEYRCLVPFTRFAEPHPAGSNAWFETTTEHSCFAGIWRPWTGDTRLVPVDGKTRRQRTAARLDLFAFLTTEPNSVVAPIHPKAMPVILTEPHEMQLWMEGYGVSLATLQRPLAADLLCQTSPPA